jgi:hypothetical protein
MIKLPHIVSPDFRLFLLLQYKYPTHSLTHSLTHGAESLRSCQLCSYSRTSQHFMEPGGSSPPSHKPSTGPYPEPDRSNPYHPILISYSAQKNNTENIHESMCPRNINIIIIISKKMVLLLQLNVVYYRWMNESIVLFGKLPRCYSRLHVAYIFVVYPPFSHH